MGIVCKLRGCTFVATDGGGDENGQCCRLERCARCGARRTINLGTDHRFAVSHATCRSYEWEGCDVTRVCELCGYRRTDLVPHRDRVTAYVAKGPTLYLLGITESPDPRLREDRSCAGTVKCRLCGRVKEDAWVREHKFVAVPPTAGPVRLPAVGSLADFDASLSARCIDRIEACKTCGTIRVTAHHKFEDLGRRDIHVGRTEEVWTNCYRCRECGYEYGEGDYQFTDLMG